MSSTAPAEKRRRRQRTDARRSILSAAESILVEDGLEGFSMRRLVDRCGYSAPTIYHYFGGKQGLIHDLLQETCQLLVVELRRAALGNDAFENLRALSVAFVHFGLRNPAQYRLLMTPLQNDSEPPPALEEARAILAAPLERIDSEGHLPGVDGETVSQSLWALLHGIISLQTTRPDHEWAPQLLELALDALIRGFVGAVETAEDPS